VKLSPDRWDKEIHECRIKDLKHQNKLQRFKQQNIPAEWILNVQQHYTTAAY
jgi:hypothetical protein